MWSPWHISPGHSPMCTTLCITWSIKPYLWYYYISCQSWSIDIHGYKYCGLKKERERSKNKCTSIDQLKYINLFINTYFHIMPNWSYMPSFLPHFNFHRHALYIICNYMNSKIFKQAICTWLNQSPKPAIVIVKFKSNNLPYMYNKIFLPATSTRAITLGQTTKRHCLNA